MAQSIEAPPAGHPLPPVRLTVLEAVTADGGKGPALNKFVTVTPDGTLEKRSYGRAYLFRRWLTDPVTDIAGLAAVLARIERNPQLCIVSGRPTGPLPLKQPARRLKYPEGDHPATLEDYPARFLPIDLDGLMVPGADIVLDPEGAVDAALEALGPEFAEVSCYWQFTAGQRPDSEELRLRLYFLTDREHTGAELARWAKHLRAAGVPVDPAIYSGAQPIYTAAPTFADGRDLLPVRSGFLERAEDMVALTIPEADPLALPGDGGTAPALGLEGHLARIGDHPGGGGIHEPIRGAIAAAVARHGSGVDREDLKARIREAVRGVVIDPHKHPARYLRDQTGDRMLDESIAGAVRKFGPEADAKLAHLARLRPDPAGLPAYPAPIEAPVVVTADGFREWLQALVADLLTNPTDADGNPRRVVVKGPVGVGKTSIVVDTTRGKVVLWFAPTTDQGTEVTLRFKRGGTDARLVLGRTKPDPGGEDGQGMCWRQEEILALKQKGLARQTASLLCQNREVDPEVGQCRHFGRCGYTRQLLDPPQILVCAHSYLPHGQTEIISKAAKSAQLAVIDENPGEVLRQAGRGEWAVDGLIAEGGSMREIVLGLLDGRPMREIVQGLDVPAVVEELEAALDELPTIDRPDVIPDASAARNLRILENYNPDPRARLRGAYRSVIEAIQGAYDRVWAGTDGQGRRWLWGRRSVPPTAVDGLPVLVLDATADEAEARAIWGEGVEFHHYHVEPKGLRVIQVRDATFYRAKLTDPDNRDWRDRVAALVQATGAGLVTYKDSLALMREEDTLADSTLTANFGGLRGRDHMKDCGAAVMAGRFEPPTYAIEDAARALWPDRGLDLGHTNLTYTVSHYQMRDGSTVPVAVRAHPDPMVNRLLIQKRDAELVQAVGRLRAIHGREGRDLFVLGSVPVPGLTVDHLVTVDELLPSARACRGLMAGGGVLPLGAKALVDLLPEEWPTEAAARSWVKRERGSFPSKGTLTGIRPPFGMVQYRVQGQRGSDTEALTWHTDPATIRERLEALHGAEVVKLDLPAPVDNSEPVDNSAPVDNSGPVEVETVDPIEEVVEALLAKIAPERLPAFRETLRDYLAELDMCAVHGTFQPLEDMPPPPNWLLMSADKGGFRTIRDCMTQAVDAIDTAYQQDRPVDLMPAPIPSEYAQWADLTAEPEPLPDLSDTCPPLALEPAPDLEAIREAYEERVAIMVVDGELDEAIARALALPPELRDLEITADDDQHRNHGRGQTAGGNPGTAARSAPGGERWRYPAAGRHRPSPVRPPVAAVPA